MTDEIDEDLLPDDLLPAPKGKAVPLRKAPLTSAQKKAVAAKAERDALNARAATLAQIVNLHIGGYSLEQIGASIGASADEVDRMLTNETARYVRNQPALRTYVRNWISGKYMTMIEADWAEASNPAAKAKLENQDRVMRMLEKMGRLHGADAPTQTEVSIDAAPEAVERLVQALASGQGLGYDEDIFDVPEEDIHEAVEQTHLAIEVSGNRVEESDGDDDF